MLTKFDLLNALFSKDNTIIINGNTCKLHAVEREDGSGDKFNLTIEHNGKKFSYFVKIPQ